MRKVAVGSDVSMVDDDDFDIISGIKWYKSSNGYAESFLKLADGKRKKVYMHRLITGCPDGKYVDHIDGNKLNNQKENLRICSHRQNMRNRLGDANTSSQYKGVTKREYDGYVKWDADIFVENKLFHIGRFDSEIVAANAYNHYAKLYFGEFAKLNDVVYIENAHLMSYKKSVASSQYRGVTWEKNVGKWRVVLKPNGKKITVGYFEDEIAAARAYDKKAIEIYGDKAKLNFPIGA